jgi:hypothetical protein
MEILQPHDEQMLAPVMFSQTHSPLQQKNKITFGVHILEKNKVTSLIDSKKTEVTLYIGEQEAMAFFSVFFSLCSLFSFL